MSSGPGPFGRRCHPGCIRVVESLVVEGRVLLHPGCRLLLSPDLGSPLSKVKLLVMLLSLLVGEFSSQGLHPLLEGVGFPMEGVPLGPVVVCYQC